VTPATGDAVLALSFTTDLVSPVINGLIYGSAYGLLALGIVLIYKSNRFFNFAIAEVGTVSLLVAQAFREGRGVFPRLPFPVACVLGVTAGVLVSLLTERLVIRPLFRAARVTLVVATAGVALLLIQLELFLSGSEGLLQFTPLSRSQLVRVGSAQITITEVLLVLSLVGAGIAAVAFFRTRYGTAVLAVSQEPTAASAVGISVGRVSMLTWGLAGLLGGLAGVAYAPKSFNVTPALLTFGSPVLIFAFVAAVLGGMTSLAGAFVGGVLLGIVEQFALVTKNNIDALSSVPGFSNLIVFILLLVVLLVRPQGLLGKEA